MGLQEQGTQKRTELWTRIRSASTATAEQAHSSTHQVRQPTTALSASRILTARDAGGRMAVTWRVTFFVAQRRSEGREDAAGGVEEVTAVQDVPSIEETARLFVRNLPYSTTEADLAEAFREHGEVSEAHLVLDRWPAMHSQPLLAPPPLPHACQIRGNTNAGSQARQCAYCGQVLGNFRFRSQK